MTVKFQKPKAVKTANATDVSHIRIPDDLREWILTQATKENRNFSNMAVQLLAEAKNARTRES